MSRVSRRLKVGAAAITAIGVMAALSGCAGAGGAGGTQTLTVATVDNPQMKDMEQLTSVFEKANPTIKVKFVTMQENDLRDAITKDVATHGGQYDLATVGAYEVPLWKKNGWLTNLQPYVDKSKSYDVNDIIAPVKSALEIDGNLYAAPFYGESSFLMYNKDLFAAKGLTMPENPTWQQVADLAVKAKTADTAGICLRGKPGWGEGAASLTTVVNTFGGAWFNDSWKAQVDQPKFAEALQFYADTLKNGGEGDPASFGFTECLNLFSQGKAAMWYDATSAAGTLETPSLSKVAGKVGYVAAPVVDTKSSGWLWSWNLGIPSDSKKKDAAWKFVDWATSKEYIKLVGTKLGWSRVPPGSRASTYKLPEYQKAAASFATITVDTMNAVDPKQPGVAKQPWVGIQYVGIPEWQDLGNKASLEFANVYAGRESVESALSKVQSLAQKAGDAQK